MGGMEGDARGLEYGLHKELATSEVRRTFQTCLCLLCVVAYELALVCAAGLGS